MVQDKEIPLSNHHQCRSLKHKDSKDPCAHPVPCLGDFPLNKQANKESILHSSWRPSLGTIQWLRPRLCPNINQTSSGVVCLSNGINYIIVAIQVPNSIPDIRDKKTCSLGILKQVQPRHTIPMFRHNKQRNLVGGARFLL